MTIKLLSRSDLQKRISEEVAKWYKDTTAAVMPGGLVHEVACECLLHAYKHGDVTLCQQLYEAVGGVSDSKQRAEKSRLTVIKSESLKAWFFKFSGRQLTARGVTWAFINKWNRTEEFWAPLLEAAEKTSIQEFAPEEQKVRPVYAGQLLSMIDNFLGRMEEKYLENADGKTHFIGNFAVTKDVCKDISEYARKRFEQEDVRSVGLAKDNNVIQFPPKEEVEGAAAPGSHPETKLLRNGQVIDGDGNVVQQPEQDQEQPQPERAVG